MAMEGAQTPPDVVEDVFEGHATDIEVEDTGEDTTRIQRPWNPDQIRVNTSQFSLRNILDQIDEGSIELAPDFQRLRVWRADQKSLLVESLLLRIPLRVARQAPVGSRPGALLPADPRVRRPDPRRDLRGASGDLRGGQSPRSPRRSAWSGALDTVVPAADRLPQAPEGKAPVS